MSSDKPSDLLTCAEVAELVGLSVNTLKVHRREGTGPKHVRLGHRTVRYRRGDVDAWVQEREVA
ncbi:MAG: helix-turn-helix domain-containing protein [Pseudomonadota bacterium]